MHGKFMQNDTLHTIFHITEHFQSSTSIRITEHVLIHMPDSESNRTVWSVDFEEETLL